MTKADYLELCSQRWDKIEHLQTLESFYDLEKRFDEEWTSLGCQVLEESLGEVPKDYRKKVNSDQIRSGRNFE